MSRVFGKGGVFVVVLLALSLAFSAACGKKESAGNANASNTGTTATPTADSAEAGKPTAALRAYYEASMRKDVAAAKRYLSAGTMRMVEETAKEGGRTADEALEEGARLNPMTVLPELSEEKISGDTATVVATAQGRPLTMQMVKEGGEWKVALDKTLQSVGVTRGGGPTQPEPEGGEEDGHGGHEEK
jgi:hypothetical protein